jgi:hypothetical protein
MKLKETSKEIRKKWRTTTIFNLYNSDYKKIKKKKSKLSLKIEEQGRKYKGNKLSGFRSRELHQRNLKARKLSWYTWANPKFPKDACLNLNPSSYIYRELDLQKTIKN